MAKIDNVEIKHIKDTSEDTQEKMSFLSAWVAENFGHEAQFLTVIMQKNESGEGGNMSNFCNASPQDVYLMASCIKKAVEDSAQ